ncbi:MAG TPA: ATP-binding protein [Polyangia bacterium]
MKLGPRLALVTTLLMAGVFAVVATTVLSIRRVDLERDLERGARELADALAAGLEPIDPSQSLALLEARVEWANQRGGPFRLEALVAAGQRTDDPGWTSLIEAARAADAPMGRFFPAKPVFYMAIPLHNQLPGNPARQQVAFLGLKHDAGYIGAEVGQTAWRLLPLLLLGTLIFGAIVYFLLASGVVTPLRRLIDAIDAVSKGDLSRALLPEKDDEIGSLAARFNAMTNYLREAREEQARANAARLGAETRLRHSEKLATMGQMAAEIAHEVGTPLNVIGGRARSLTRRSQDPTEVVKIANIIGTQVERITKIIRQVLDFSRKSRPTLTQVDVHRVVSEALEFVDESLRRLKISASVHAAHDLPRIPGDPGEIQQVCLNLVMNAIHAMPGGGRMTIGIYVVNRRKEGLALSAPAPYLVLEVGDTGGGVPFADREKIFEAFFTTKDTGEGTGLGLAVANGIVKDHDGWIEVDDRPQGGALFRVFLPVAHFAAGEATQDGVKDGTHPPENGDADTRRSERALVPAGGIGKHERAGRGDA